MHVCVRSHGHHLVEYIKEERKAMINKKGGARIDARSQVSPVKRPHTGDFATRCRLGTNAPHKARLLRANAFFALRDHHHCATRG